MEPQSIPTSPTLELNPSREQVIWVGHILQRGGKLFIGSVSALLACRAGIVSLSGWDVP